MFKIHKNFLLNIRNICFVVASTTLFIWLAIGRVHYVQSQTFMDGGEHPYNEELTKKIFPYIKWTQILMTLCSPVLIAISIKHPQVIKLYIFYIQIYTLLG